MIAVDTMVVVVHSTRKDRKYLFFPQVMKLQSVKSEIRYTPNMILVKLVGSHNISQVILRISDIKRTKMVHCIVHNSVILCVVVSCVRTTDTLLHLYM